MLCLASGEGGTRPLGVLVGQGACASCAFAAAWSPRKPQQPSFHLLRDLHRHMFQIVNDIETDRFIYIYIDTSMATLKLKKKYHCGALTNIFKRMRQWQLETRR
jgi:hypothetical protein